ncbi:hypothetical protein [Sphingopyxis sp. Root154]|uniref:hypothetical protein n=1 Tax=Sphingopyxis sp. Root154 TaxID=1736476 RepID=UPI0012E3A073|nr:hypothetical protein [Sphingopyxis sp. Root154]
MAEILSVEVVEGRNLEKSVDHLSDQAAKFAPRQRRRLPGWLIGPRIDRGIGPKKGRKCIQIEVHNIL